ncbi:MAG: agmatine deiminase family protein [Pseudomonadota bacterium]
MNDTPKAAGFSMPPEWELHARTWMMWPCRKVVWPDMEATRRNYRDVAHAIRDFEPLTMVVRPEDMEGARNLLGSDIDLIDHPIDDSWARDAGPNFLKDAAGDVAGVAFDFNAWGGKYDPYDGDNAVAEAILDAAGVPAFVSRLTAEGGGISVDGEGTVLTTESCFPNANRNPNWTRDQIEEELMEALGAEKVIWLPGNVEETETDGHVDGVAVFAAPGVVLIQSDEEQEHYWRDIHRANVAALEGQTDAKGREIKLIKMPDAWRLQTGVAGEEFCDSYVNFYICNGGIIMPHYGIREDGLVAEILQDAFPGRRISQVPIPDIAGGGGGIHCITQQEPAPGV